MGSKCGQRVERVSIICTGCGKEVKLLASQLSHRNTDSFHCSRECYLKTKQHIHKKRLLAEKADNMYKPVLKKSFEEAYEIVLKEVREKERLKQQGVSQMENLCE